MTSWYTRPIVPVADVATARQFYLDALGFEESWRHEEGGRLLVAQLQRDGCELILSSQWPEKSGQAMLFISLEAETLDALKSDLDSRSVPAESGWWGYPLTIVRDPDGNSLLFPHPQVSQ